MNDQRRGVKGNEDPTGHPAVWYRLADLDPWQENPRDYSRESIESLAALIVQHGFNTVLNAHWPTRRIVRGHRRRLALLSIMRADPTFAIAGSPGPGYVPVRFRAGAWDGASNAEGDAVADNRAQEDGAWDEGLLGKIVVRWQAEGDSLQAIAKSTAFADDELRAIVANMHPERKAPKDVAPPEAPDIPRQADSKPGQVYELGPHRLICGDCTDLDVIAELMAGHKADVSIEDPPFAIYGSSSGLDSSIADDKVVRPFFAAILRSTVFAVRPFAPVYVCCDWRSWAAWWDSAKPVKLAPANMLVWDKGNAGLGSNYANGHELIGYFLAKPERTKMFKGATGITPILKPNMLRGDYGAGDDGPARHNLVDVLDAAGAPVDVEDRSDMAPDNRVMLRYGRVTGAERVHNAAKPFKLIAELLEHSTKPGQMVVDHFGGSGTVLLVCAQQERIARVAEIDPMWCDVIRHRWTLWAREAGVDPGRGELVMARPPTVLGAGAGKPPPSSSKGAKAPKGSAKADKKGS